MPVTEHGVKLAAVEQAFRSLPDRYLGAQPGFAASYRIRLGDLGRVWEVRADARTVRVANGTTRRRPDVTISTDAETWLALRQGAFSGVDAFRRRRLAVRGNLDLAIAFEGLFRLPNGRPPLLHIRDVGVGRHRVSTLTMGQGDDVLLIHGLGGTRASMFDTAAALSRRYRVHAVDLPGFGSSSKPAMGRYNAGWFSDIMLALMDELGIGRAHLVGNSMGGRIAIEMGLRAPERVRSLGLLCPAVAWVRRGLHPIVRLLRPEFGLLPHNFTRAMVAGQFWDLFYDRDAIDPAVGDMIVDEFRRIYHSAGARYAFLACARNIYLERPFGRGGFYPRLAELAPPALFIWGSDDPLVPHAFSRHVGRWLAGAEQITLPECGHLPQVEHPEETNALLNAFFARVEGSGLRRHAAARGLSEPRPADSEAA
ncbi:MAG TPA: alpha/beta fold hydrolase [Solirubrobacteraceae bacterium]|nr:alpha/beta fold hydrolase [Solirubrobacteraceae bacterium]